MKKGGFNTMAFQALAGLPSSNNTNVGSMQCQIESFAAGWPLSPLGGNPIIGLTALQTPGKLVCILTCTKIQHQLFIQMISSGNIYLLQKCFSEGYGGSSRTQL